jgi:hypothetical protein
MMREPEGPSVPSNERGEGEASAGRGGIESAGRIVVCVPQGMTLAAKGQQLDGGRWVFDGEKWVKQWK